MFYIDQHESYKNLKNYYLFKCFGVKEFLCLFKVNSALENNLSLGTDIATGYRYLLAIFVKIGYTFDKSFQT